MSEMFFYFKAEGDNLTLLDVKNTAYTGNINSYICRFKLNRDWDRLTVFAVFYCGENSYTAHLSDDFTCTLPHEVLMDSGAVNIGLFGTNASESDLKRISTNTVNIAVKNGAYSEEAIAPSSSAPDMWEMLLNRNIPQIGDNGNWFIWDTENKAYTDSGISAKGADGYTPQKGIDYFTDEDMKDYVKNTDYATYQTGGVVRTNAQYGIVMKTGGYIGTYLANNDEIAAKEHLSKPIVPYNLDKAVKESTHQNMSEEYDPEGMVKSKGFSDAAGTLPASYDAVKNYVDKKQPKNLILTIITQKTDDNGDIIVTVDHTPTEAHKAWLAGRSLNAVSTGSHPDYGPMDWIFNIWGVSDKYIIFSFFTDPSNGLLLAGSIDDDVWKFKIL